jgi:hypothetical protein
VGHLKIFFSRTIGPISTRLASNHPRVKGTQVSSKEGGSFSPKGDNSQRVKIHRFFLNLLVRQIQSNLVQIVLE